MSAETIAAVGSLASGLGSLGSAFGGGSPKVDYRGAKKGIRWRVRDARIAGIHPLYAMGAPGVGQGILKPDNSSDIGTAISGVGSALSDYADYRQRKVMQDATVEQVAAKTELLRKEQDWLDEQIAASQQNRLQQGANSYAGPPPAIQTRTF